MDSRRNRRVEGCKKPKESGKGKYTVGKQKGRCAMDTAGPVHYIYFTPAGPVTIEARAEAITRVELGKKPLCGTFRPNALTNLAATEIQEYLAGKRRAFTVPYRLCGSAFQLKVWKGLSGIDYAQTTTAAELARAIGHPGAHRAVGAAVRANQLSIIIPDHRLVRADGRPWGEGGKARVRQALLKLEQAPRR